MPRWGTGMRIGPSRSVHNPSNAAAAALSYLETINLDGPSFAYAFNDTAAPAVSAIGGVSLTDPGGVNSPLYAQTPGPALLGATPDTCIAWDTDGSHSYYLLGPTMATAAFNLNSGDFTMEAWIRFTNTGLYRTIMRANYSTSGSYIFRLSDTTAKIEGFAGGLAQSSTALTINTWTHVAFVRTGTSGQMFINGVADGAAVGGQTNGVGTAAGSDLFFGLAPGSSEKFMGQTAWVAGYKTALSAGRLLAHYNARV